MCLLSMVVRASMVPYPNGLSGKSAALFEVLQRNHLTGDRKAILNASDLVLALAEEEPPKKLWAKLTYIAVLLDNDSIQKAEHLLSDSSAFLSSDVPDWLTAHFHLDQGILFASKGDYPNGESYLIRASDKTASEYRELQLLVTMALAENLRFQGKLEQSKVKWYESFQLAEALSDSVHITDAYVGRGIVRFLQGELDLAKNDYDVFYGYNKRNGNRKKVAQYWSLLGLLEYQKGNYQRSIELNIKGFEIREDLNDFKGLGESLNNLALGHMGLGNWSQAQRYLEQALELKTRANDLSQTTGILNNIGRCLSKLNENEKAEEILNIALERGKRNGQLADVITTHAQLVELNQKLKDFKTAFYHQSEIILLQDSLNKTEKDKVVQELQVRYDTQMKEREIELLQKERAIITNRWLSLAMGLFMAIILGILFIDGQKRRHRQETRLLKTEEQLRIAELKNLNDRLDYNQKKLELYTENLLRKNELVGQLESKLKETVQTSVPEARKSKKIIQDFSGVRILTEKDWDEFKQLFDNVHKGLLDRLLSTFSDLTLADQRIFLLAKLNLSTAQSANILGVSPDSVKKARYRLKKKLQLPDETSLQEFVNIF